MNRSNLLSSVWMRVVVFLWMIVFPILFVGIPVVEMAWKERDVSMTPVWAFVVWMLGPLVLAIVLKNFGPSDARKIENKEK